MTRKEIIAETMAQYWNVRDDLKDKSLDDLKQIVAADTLPFAVCAINVTGDLNLGIMMRTASLMGAERFIIYGRHNYDRRTTVGAQNYIDVLTCGLIDHDGNIDYSQFTSIMTTYRYSPVYFDTDGVPLAQLDMNKYDDYRRFFGYNPCLVFGNEGLGIPEQLKNGGTVVTIPQRGVLRSLNVSAAASIAIHHFSTYMSLSSSPA